MKDIARMNLKELKAVTGLNMARGNRKLDRSILIWSIPAVETCPNCKHCAKQCYARKAERIYPQVLPARKRNLAASRQDWFTPAMIQYIKLSGARVVRIHESGDFYDQSYADKWSAIIKACPDVRFYGYTKSPYRPAPASNLNIVESILPDGRVGNTITITIKARTATVCAWCGAHLAGPLDPTTPASHGICQACAERLRGEWGALS